MLAALVIFAGFAFVKYYNGYEAPGEHWAPASPIAHATARFATDMGAAGDYRISIEKLSSKAPLFFVQYQAPGPILDVKIHSDDGIVRLSQQFADEGQYRITVQHTISPEHKEVIGFTVQTPLVKYTNDVLLFAFLLLAGFFSGKRLQRLAVVMFVLLASGLSLPQTAMAHHMSGGKQHGMTISHHVNDVQLRWLHGKAPVGAANRQPMDWSMQLIKGGKPVQHAVYDVDFIHLETHFPVLHIEGISTGNGTIELRYSPPDGANYQLQVRTVIDNKVYHLALNGSAEAIPPSSGRKWASFLLMMIPVLTGMAWGWKRSANG